MTLRAFSSVTINDRLVIDWSLIVTVLNLNNLRCVIKISFSLYDNYLSVSWTFFWPLPSISTQAIILCEPSLHQYTLNLGLASSNTK